MLRRGCRPPAATVRFVGVRHTSWTSYVNPLTWFSGPPRATNPNIEQDLPDVFANQPREVEDYIRPEKSIFEKAEDIWESFSSLLQPVEGVCGLLRKVKHDGLFSGFITFDSWGTLLFTFGLCTRLITLIPGLYSNRNALRMNRVSARISEIDQSLQKAKADKSLTTAEQRVVKDGYNRIKKALYAEAKAAPWKTFVQGAAAPIMMLALMSIRQLVVYEPALHKQPFLWVTDLTEPDPTYILPAACTLLFLSNFELNQRLQRGGRSSLSMYIRWGTRCGSVIFTYYFSSQPAALFAYWIGVSAAGMLQPVLLRNTAFRRFFDFPDPPAAAAGIVAGASSASSGPTLYQRLFASKEELQRLADAAKAEAERKRFQHVSDFEVVFDAAPPEKKK